MKKIMCLIDGLRLGGAQRQLIGLTQFLRQKGYITDLVTYLPDNFYEDLFTQYGFKPLYIPAHGYLGKLIKIHQIIHSSHYDTVIAFLDGPTSLCSILKMAGLDFQLIVSERNTTQTLTIKEKIKFFLYRFSDYIVPNSISQETYIHKKFPHLAHKIHTIHNFTDTDYFIPQATTDDKNSQQQSLSKPLVILTPARISRQKNILRYLKAISIVKQCAQIPIIFKWIGDVQHSETAYQKLCMQRIKELNIEDMIEFLPASENILFQYQQSDIICLPSLFEGFPNVVCEAMSCGKPVLCSNICDNPHIVKDGVTGYLFDPTSPQSIAKAIQRIGNQTTKERALMGMQARNYAITHFSKQTFTDKYLQLITSH